uniref:Uncharacterized protein n=1 Tax=Cacopsylla melanoneura TaxID=428564 RepID=A0A8D8US76_9HEMI
MLYTRKRVVTISSSCLRTGPRSLTLSSTLRNSVLVLALKHTRICSPGLWPSSGPCRLPGVVLPKQSPPYRPPALMIVLAPRTRHRTSPLLKMKRRVRRDGRRKTGGPSWRLSDEPR